VSLVAVVDDNFQNGMRIILGIDKLVYIPGAIYRSVPFLDIPGARAINQFYTTDKVGT